MKKIYELMAGKAILRGSIREVQDVCDSLGMNTNVQVRGFTEDKLGDCGWEYDPDEDTFSILFSGFGGVEVKPKIYFASRLKLESKFSYGETVIWKDKKNECLREGYFAGMYYDRGRYIHQVVDKGNHHVVNFTSVEHIQKGKLVYMSIEDIEKKLDLKLGTLKIKK